jgi:hypothetical protein
VSQGCEKVTGVKASELLSDAGCRGTHLPGAVANAVRFQGAYSTRLHRPFKLILIQYQ